MVTGVSLARRLLPALILVILPYSPVNAAPPGDASKLKASSYAPHAHNAHRVYGTPIAGPIFRKRIRAQHAPKHAPQLRSVPLSDAG